MSPGESVGWRKTRQSAARVKSQVAGGERIVCARRRQGVRSNCGDGSRSAVRAEGQPRSLCRIPDSRGRPGKNLFADILRLAAQPRPPPILSMAQRVRLSRVPWKTKQTRVSTTAETAFSALCAPVSPARRRTSRRVQGLALSKSVESDHLCFGDAVTWRASVGNQPIYNSDTGNQGVCRGQPRGVERGAKSGAVGANPSASLAPSIGRESRNYACAHSRLEIRRRFSRY